MAKITRINLPWTTVYADSTTERSLAATPWMDASKVDQVRTIVEFRERVGDLKVCIGYETADVPNNPGSHAKIGSLLASEGVTFPTAFTDISSATAGKQLIRFVWVTANDSSSDLNPGRVAGVVEILEK